MAGFIVFNDGRAWAAANWAYDAAIRYIAQALPTTSNGQELANWLIQQTTQVQGQGLGAIDLRELTQNNQLLLLEAIRKAAKNLKTHDGKEWSDPSAFTSWKMYFEILSKLMDSIERGESPFAYNPHMNDIIPPTGNKSGPGWEKA